MVTVSYFCALLMRMSWAPMEGMSDLSLGMYWIPATLLTVITTAVAAAQMHTVSIYSAQELPLGILFPVAVCTSAKIRTVSRKHGPRSDNGGTVASDISFGRLATLSLQFGLLRRQMSPFRSAADLLENRQCLRKLCSICQAIQPHVAQD